MGLGRAVMVRLAAWPLIFVVLLNGWFYVQQPRITFYPFAVLEATPSSWGLSHEEVELTTDDGVKLHGWYLPHPAATHTMLFFHGNGGNISHRGDSLLIFHRLGLSVLIIDYRGYGRSGGEADEGGLYLDAQAAWRYLLLERGIRAENIIIFGRSLGGAVAVDLASRVEPAGVILESTFSSAREVAAELFPLLSPLILLRYDFDSAVKIEGLSAPLLMLHSPQDEIIPFHLGRRLYAVAPQPKQFVELQGGHNDGFLRSGPGYELALHSFIASLPQRP